MLIVILTVLMILAAIGLEIWYQNTCSCNDDWKEVLSLFFGLLGGVCLFIELLIILGVQCTATIDYEKTVYQKEVLEYRLENQENYLNGNELLYSDITIFNNKLRTHKYYSDNVWINWFFNQKIDEIEYIELDTEKS